MVLTGEHTMTATEMPPTVDDLLAISADEPEVEENDSELPQVPFNTALLDQFFKAKKAEADAKQEKDEVGQRIRIAAEPLRIAEAARGKALVKSILLAGKLRFTTKNQWPKLK